LTGAKGDKGDAGAGSLHVADANGHDVGMYADDGAAGNVIMQVQGVWVRVPLNDSSSSATAPFAECSGMPGGCPMLYFKDDSCGGTPYVQGSHGLVQSASVVGDQVRFPGAISSQSFASYGDGGASCNPWHFTADAGEMHSVDAATLSIQAPLSLSR
jgi:hypothetical protein